MPLSVAAQKRIPVSISALPASPRCSSGTQPFTWPIYSRAMSPAIAWHTWPNIGPYILAVAAPPSPTYGGRQPLQSTPSHAAGGTVPTRIPPRRSTVEGPLRFLRRLSGKPKRGIAPVGHGGQLCDASLVRSHVTARHRHPPSPIRCEQRVRTLASVVGSGSLTHCGVSCVPTPLMKWGSRVASTWVESLQWLVQTKSPLWGYQIGCVLALKAWFNSYVHLLPNRCVWEFFKSSLASIVVEKWAGGYKIGCKPACHMPFSVAT